MMARTKQTDTTTTELTFNVGDSVIWKGIPLTINEILPDGRYVLSGGRMHYLYLSDTRDLTKDAK
jgi:hypothetical protein